MRINTTNLFDQAVSRLNGKNLDNLWLVSCIFSCLEYFSNWEKDFTFFFPMINHANSLMFTKAVIYSNALPYKTTPLKSSDFPFVLNNIGEASIRTDIFYNEKTDVSEKVSKVFSTMASSQLWFTRKNFPKRLALYYALYYDLPHKYRDELREKHKSNFIDIPKSIETLLGISLEKYFILGLYLWLGYENRYNKVLEPTPEQKQEFIKSQGYETTLNQKREIYIKSLIDKCSELFSIFTFNIDMLKKELPFIKKDEFENFFKITAKSTRDIRELNRKPDYQKGYISERLSPLERFPIIKLSNDQFIIPNLRYFDLALTELLRFALGEIYRNNAFHEVIGSIQEFYLKELIENRLKNGNLIPEITYLRAGSEYKGPDFTLIENERLIVIETKSKHITLDTRIAPDSESLINDLDSSFKALKKLADEKIPDIYSKLDEYQSYQNSINKAKQNLPICVIVIGLGTFSMQEVITFYKNKQHNFFLNSYSYPYCVIDLLNFTKAVEISVAQNIPLYSLLEEYWKTGNDVSPHKYSADSFQNREFDAQKTFLHEYFLKLLEKVRSYKEPSTKSISSS